jgi:hypothetical protein
MPRPSHSPWLDLPNDIWLYVLCSVKKLKINTWNVMCIKILTWKWNKT